MSDYIVKDDGTASGDTGRYAAGSQSGSFATLGTANYYASFAAALAATTAPASGDRILFSDLHAFNDSSATNDSFSVGIQIICVDDANMDAARTSGNRGKITNSLAAGSSPMTEANMVASGIEIEPNDDMIFVSGNNILIDSKLVIDGGRLDITTAQNVSLTLRESELALNQASGDIRITGGCTFRMYGGSITTTSAGITNFMNTSSAGVGGMNLEIVGANAEAITGTLFSNIGGNASTDDLINIFMDMCKLASGVTHFNEVFKNQMHRGLITRSSDVSADAEFQYHLRAFGGDVEDDSTIRRADDLAFEDSGTIISYEIITNSDANIGAPLWFDLPWRTWAELATGATDTLRFFLASTTTLTNKDIWIELIYPDGTNKQTPNFFASSNNTVGGVIDLMAAGTTLTTDSGSDWRDGGSALTGHNEYQIDVTTSGDVGADTVPIVRVYVGKPSVTIQLASIYEFN